LRTSVIIPARNAEATIERAIRSALDQTPAPCEILVGDDGSTDSTASTAERLGANVLRLQPLNGSAARNRAVEAATGDRLFFLDADDEWLPGKIALHLELRSRHDVCLIMDPARRISPSGEPRGLNGAGPEGLLDWRALTDHKNWTSGSSFSVDRQSYRDMGGFSERLSKTQDVDFWVRCAHRFGPAYRAAECRTLYHQSPLTITSRPVDPDSYLPTLFEGWPFAGPQERANVTRICYLNLVRLQTLGPAFRALGKAGWPMNRAIAWKYLVFALRNSVRGGRG